MYVSGKTVAGDLKIKANDTVDSLPPTSCHFIHLQLLMLLVKSICLLLIIFYYNDLSND